MQAFLSRLFHGFGAVSIALLMVCVRVCSALDIAPALTAVISFSVRDNYTENEVTLMFCDVTLVFYTKCDILY